MTEDLHHLAAAYVLNALDDRQQREFEAHYPSCAICSAEVADYRETTALLAESQAATPPRDLKAKIMSEVAETRQIAPVLPERVVDLAERKRRKQPRQRVLAAVAAGIVAVAGFFGSLQFARSSDDSDVLIAADAITVALEGDAGQATVVWSESQDRGVLIVAGLDDPGPGQAYELWLIDADGASPTGVFTPEGDGTAEIDVSLDGRTPVAWGITIEPETGSDQPTEPILLISQTS